MRVMHIMDCLTRGGAESLILDVCRNVHNHGLDFTFAATGTGDLANEFAALDIDQVWLKRCLPVDPENATHGVQDESVNPISDRIITDVAEHIPFPDGCFDVVYSSHAIEHFSDLSSGIREISRVLKPDGRAILMIPTGTMAAILVVSYWLFYTHRSIGKFLLRTRSSQGFLQIFLGEPHGTESQYAVQEITKFRIKRWRELIGSHLKIECELLPCLYPWPNFPQFFPLIRSKWFSTSVAFVCKNI